MSDNFQEPVALPDCETDSRNLVKDVAWSIKRAEEIQANLVHAPATSDARRQKLGRLLTTAKCYEQNIREIKGIALKVMSELVRAALVTVWLPLAETEDDAIVVQGLEDFLNDLNAFDIRATNNDNFTFQEILDVIQELLREPVGSEGTVAQLSARKVEDEIDSLVQKQLREHAEVTKMLPTCYLALGFSGRSRRTLLLIALSPLMVMVIVAYFVAETTWPGSISQRYHAMLEASAKAKEYGKEIDLKRVKLQILCKREEQDEKKGDANWTTIRNDLKTLSERVRSISPKLMAWKEIPDAVRTDVCDHIKFLRGENNKDPAERMKVMKEMARARMEYEAMKALLTAFFIE
ncbi:hypothetical protein C8F01DRAFT_1247896 [Mycena amicta]|nr:hypothetical protein C8F01DRAFT_1247896 [Mycena amicta]